MRALPGLPLTTIAPGLPVQIFFSSRRAEKHDGNRMAMSGMRPFVFAGGTDTHVRKISSGFPIPEQPASRAKVIQESCDTSRKIRPGISELG